MPCRLCAVFLLNADGKTLRLAALAGQKDGPPDPMPDLVLADSVLGSAIRHKKQVEVFSLVHTEEHHFTQLLPGGALVSLLVTPIVVDDHAIGALNVYTERHHRFNNDERRIFSTLANLCAVAVQNADLYTRVFASEESLRKNERLTTLGLIAAEIAHEIRNPLTVITLLLDTMDLRFPDDDVRAQDLTVIREKLGHLGEIVERVLGFSKSGTTLQARWSLGAVIEETLRLLRLKLEQSKIVVQFHPPASPLLVDAHKGQLQQVLLNLILNAVQAMPQGGKLLIDLRAEIKDHAHLAVVTIRDHGPGVPPSLRACIFESFLTARKDGTGLGLAICKRILRDHRGDIELVETPADKGATFKFWLPSAG
jgi:signal transduction histidine kinase